MTALEMVFSIWLFLHRLKSKVRALSENEFNRMLPAYLHVEAIIKQRGGRNIEIKQENGVVNV